MDGLELCSRIIGTRADVPVIVVTGNGSMETAVAAMRAGAYDFLTKPIDVKLLALERRPRGAAPSLAGGSEAAARGVARALRAATSSSGRARR